MPADAWQPCPPVVLALCRIFWWGTSDWRAFCVASVLSSCCGSSKTLLLLQDDPLPGSIAPPLPLSPTLGAASGCLQWQVLAPDMRVQKKNGSSCVRLPAVAGAHPDIRRTNLKAHCSHVRCAPAMSCGTSSATILPSALVRKMGKGSMRSEGV